MTTPESGSDLQGLIAASATSERAQAEQSDAVMAARAKPSRTKLLVGIALLLAFVLVAWQQYPRMRDPFGSPDPMQDATAAQAHLVVLAGSIDAYHAAQGQYPQSLDALDLPDEAAVFVKQQAISYRVTEKAYGLEWMLPYGRAVFDSETGEARVSNSP